MYLPVKACHKPVHGRGHLEILYLRAVRKWKGWCAKVISLYSIWFTISCYQEYQSILAAKIVTPGSRLIAKWRENGEINNLEVFWLCASVNRQDQGYCRCLHRRKKCISMKLEMIRWIFQLGFVPSSITRNRPGLRTSQNLESVSPLVRKYSQSRQKGRSLKVAGRKNCRFFFQITKSFLHMADLRIGRILPWTNIGQLSGLECMIEARCCPLKWLTLDWLVKENAFIASVSIAGYAHFHRKLSSRI